MTRLIYPLLVLLICLPVAVLALRIDLPGLTSSSLLARPLAVPTGDQELAWMHTTTSGLTWERFVTGVVRAKMLVPGLVVDESLAFREQTTQVPEVRIAYPGRRGSLRIRWYKLSNDVGPREWMAALAERNPPPLAVIGGATSDRAGELAVALREQTHWKGSSPLLLLTTATAETIRLVDSTSIPATPGGRSEPLMSIYPQRTFRFCFRNQQLAEAVLDFVWQQVDLRPGILAPLARAAAGSGLMIAAPTRSWEAGAIQPPRVFMIAWQDDPFSTDLHQQFFHWLIDPKRSGLSGRNSFRNRGEVGEAVPHSEAISSWTVPFSIGGYHRPNRYEADVYELMLQKIREVPDQRSLLIIPSVTQPARRLMSALADALPGLGQRLVAVTGDGISVNAIYRDGDFAWPMHMLPIPLVLFAHHNPVAWDPPGTESALPPSYRLTPPTSSEDVLFFSDLVRVICQGSFQLDEASDSDALDVTGLVKSSEALAERLHRMRPPVFDADGNRLGGQGEYVVVVRPQLHRHDPGLPSGPEAILEVWRRGPERHWERVQQIEIDQWRVRSPS